MRAFVFAYDRYDSMTTALMLEQEGLEHVVLCHSDEARQRFIDHGTASADRLISTGEPKGLANNRNAALEMMDDDEWALFLVDDLKDVSTVAGYGTRSDLRLGITMDNQAQYRSTMKEPCSMREFVDYSWELAAACDAVGARLGGFCGISNPIFRDAKWRFNVLADGRAWIVKKGSMRFDLGAQLIDDVCWTAQNIQRYGVVVVNQWILPDCRRYTAGAFGSIEERLPQKRREAEHLVSAYPALVRHAKKAGWPDGTHVQLRRTLDRQTSAALEATAADASARWRTARAATGA